jgi:hypothetical protein
MRIEHEILLMARSSAYSRCRSRSRSCRVRVVQMPATNTVQMPATRNRTIAIARTASPSYNLSTVDRGCL